ncbi:hypothetical protein [Maribacter sp. 1_MG-2023]|uniref:hypothetical protein n=1 Tax=Maribacter sp. 1_MG-2023 TaxID=3062677 RepID=UPI0026E13179|nr:hypothetical protein [Maribacter sp. 1_MG-2023]MDO6470295.1 hypothetical protein [Maribacter sp. 1_MG-2023]
MKNLFLIVLLLIWSVSFSQDEKNNNAEALAQKLANPIASLISVPFQQNMDFGIGDLNGSRYTVNIQPVLPFQLSENVILITRVVLPVVSQYNITGVGESETGLSDAVVTAFLSPTKSKITWGVGPALLIPTGTDDFLTTKKFGIGPSAVALVQSGANTYGVLVNQLWSVAGSSDRPDVNQFFIQPFIAHNWASGAGVSFIAEYTQNWEASQSTLWFPLLFQELQA